MTRKLALPLALLITVGIWACGDNQADEDTGMVEQATPAPEAAPVAPMDTTTAGTMGSAARLDMASSGEYGQYLTDSNGRAVYLFEADSAGQSTCYDQCAQAWPPVTGQSATVAAGLQQNLVGTIQPRDGTTQLTYNGHPLYYFQRDQQPGSTQGEGMTGFGAPWYLVSPSGMPVEGAHSQQSSDSTGSSGH